MIIPYYVLLFTVVFTLHKIPVESKQQVFDTFSSHQLKTDCECGQENDFVTRIVGGRIVQPNQYPWMVAIFYSGSLLCGGSIINDRYILTAGHCLEWVRKEKVQVVLAMHDRVLMETLKKGGLSLEIGEFFVHENFTKFDVYDINDIALIKLKKPLNFSSVISPVCLPTSKDKDYTDSMARIIGWGRTSANSETSRYLKEAEVKVISNEQCKKSPTVGKNIISTMMCAYQKKTDACQGDSGGPLTFETNKGSVEQIGLVSWGIGCASPKIPGIYTRITSYLDWIASHTKDAMYCKIPS